MASGLGFTPGLGSPRGKKKDSLSENWDSLGERRDSLSEVGADQAALRGSGQVL